MIPTISYQGMTANRHEDKAHMLMGISSPPPTPYDGGEDQEAAPGMARLTVDENLVEQAFRGTSSKKSPGPDGIGPLAIRCVYDWEPERVVALARARIRLVTHPDRWKTGRGGFHPRAWRGRLRAGQVLPMRLPP